jgi:hypothetical protein
MWGGYNKRRVGWPSFIQHTVTRRAVCVEPMLEQVYQMEQALSDLCILSPSSWSTWHT